MYQYDKYELEEELEMLEADLRSEEELLNYKRIELNNILQGVGYLQKRIAEIKETLAGNNYQQVQCGLPKLEYPKIVCIVDRNGVQHQVSDEMNELLSAIESTEGTREEKEAIKRFIFPEIYNV